jgi:general secretion pathway protein G
MVNFKKEAKLQAIMPIGMVLLGLLAALVLPNYLRTTVDRRSQAVHATIATLITALDAYKQDVGSYPTTEQGLSALRVRPEGAVSWNGPYLSKNIPNDPWGRPYIYKWSPDKIPDPARVSHWKPMILSFGADGAPGGTGENADILGE